MHGGSPSEWRTNFVLIRKALFAAEQSDIVAANNMEVEEVREITYAVVNAMRRSDNAAFKRIMRYAVDRWPVREQADPYFPDLDEDERLEQLSTRIAEAYADPNEGRG